MNNIGLKVLAFFTAVMSWLMVVNIDDPVTTQTYYNIPVSVINDEVLTQAEQTYRIVDDTQTVNVVVSANRSVLNKIRNEDIAAIADMKELTLNTQIPIRVSIRDFENKYKDAYATPRNLIVELEEEETKKFPIVPATSGTVRDGYALGDIRALPEKVSIRGPKSVIQRINRVEAAVNVSGMSADELIQSQLVLYDSDNREIDQSLLKNNLGGEGVAVSVQILKVKNIPVLFDESGIGVADGYSIKEVTYEPKEVQITGTEEALRKIDEIRIPASVLKMNGLTGKTEKVVDIAEYLPDSVRLADENAGRIFVTVFVEKNGTKNFDISLGSIAVEGLDENLKLSYETEDVVEIQVRGPEDILETFDVKGNVQIDLTEYKEPGKYTVPVMIQLPQGCALEIPVSLNIILEKK